MRTNPATSVTTNSLAAFPESLTLSDGRIVLRSWQQADADALHAAAVESAAMVGRWLPWCHADYQPQEAVDWIARCRAGWQDGSYLALPVFDAQSGQLLGALGLNQFNPTHRSANLGYWVRLSQQRQGVAVAACRLAARFGFSRLGLARIEIVVLPDNLASRRTAEKLGARYEGVARHRLLVDGQPRDAAIYALIPADLEAAA
jgi:RimJ/RimL family protein N-acetyltransferase